MATWDVRRHNCISGNGREISTCPEFPGYSIVHDDGTPDYLIVSPVGPIGNRPKFAEAEELVTEDSKLVAGATQVQLREYRTPEWLRERNNDPYGTPGKHEFWATVTSAKFGVYRVFERDGWWFAYGTQHNAWLHFDSSAACFEHVAKPAIDPWS